jgi:RimJ/RimL family protein N-acetyltransferase
LTDLHGTTVTLRPLEPGDGDALRAIHATPGVAEWWGDPEDGFPFGDDPDATRFSILVDGRVAGLVQYTEEPEADYRHASIDIFLDPPLHGRGHGTDALATLVRHLLEERGHHRITIDPAVDNAAAIRSYEKAGFRPVGVLQAAWCDGSGAWRDVLLMELVSLRERDGSASASPAAVLRRLVNGYQVSQAIHVAATLGIADLLADGPRTSDDLAAATATHPRSLYRLLRALASVGVFHEEDGRRFALTPLGDCLRSDAPEPVGGWAAFVGRPSNRQAWGALLDSVRTGENAFRAVHGVGVWEYRVHHPEESAIFDRAMADLTRLVDRALVDAYDFSRFDTLVDVGGGNGALLGAILARHPALHGVLFDQPHVVAAAAAKREAAGVADRCRIVGGSFFETVPEDGDAYILKAIVHDWEDEEAAAILRVCRSAMPADGVLLVIERTLGAPNEDPDAKLMDLNMLVAPGGQERTVEEFGELLAGAGLRLTQTFPTSAGLSILEAEVVSPGADRARSSDNRPKGTT